MKRAFLYMAFVAVLSLSCSKIDENALENGLKTMTFTASYTSMQKTALSGYSILWESSDRISVFDHTGANREFITFDRGVSAAFKGEAIPSDDFKVLYPYDASASLEDNVIRTSVKSSQSAVKGTFASGSNISVASFTGTSASLKNALACVKFTIAPTTLNISSIKFESISGEPLSGPVEISLQDDYPSAKAAPSSAAYVNIVPSTSYIEPGEYVFNALPGTLSDGFRLTFLTNNGKTFVKEGTKPATLTRSRILDLGVIDLATLVEIEEEPDDTSDDPISKYASFGVDFSKLTQLGHPRIFLTSSDFAALKKRVIYNPDPNDIAFKLHRTLMANADESAASEELASYTIVGGKRLLEQSRAALERMFRCAYAYRMTGESKYLTKARTELSTVCNPAIFPDWNDKIHFLDPSEMAMAVAITYDWLYYDLTLEERRAAHAALTEYELKPFKKYNPSTTTNWNMVCNGGALAAAVAVYEKDKSIAAYDIDKAIGSNLEAADYYYNPNGNGIEGNGYWSYAMDFQISIINILETAFGTSCGIADFPGFKKSGLWKLFMTGPTGGYNFSDGGSDTLDSTPEFIWLAARFNQPELLVLEWKYLDGSSYSSNRMLPLMMSGLAKYPFTQQTASFPAEHVWYANDNSPIILTHSGWNYDETDKFFGLKGSGTVNGHCHMDAGSFVYDAFGVRWACDSHAGDYNTYEHMITGLFTYTQKSERWELLQMNNFFHNTLSFTWADGSVNKSNVTDHVVGTCGSVVSTFSDKDGGYGGTVDISCYFTDAASSVLRTMKIVGEDLHIIDAITSLPGHSAPFEWRMLTIADVTLEDGYITLRQDGKTVYLYTRTSGEVTVEPVYGYEASIVRPATWIQRDWETKYNNFRQYHVIKIASEVSSGKKMATFDTVMSPMKPSESGTLVEGEKPDESDQQDAKW